MFMVAEQLESGIDAAVANGSIGDPVLLWLLP
jgi:hypothetical protein